MVSQSKNSKRTLRWYGQIFIHHRQIEKLETEKEKKCRSLPGPQINSGIRESRHADLTISICVHTTMIPSFSNPDHRLIVHASMNCSKLSTYAAKLNRHENREKRFGIRCVKPRGCCHGS
ncbi:unnamed protein product [Lathyrus oleraceus]